MESQVKLPIHTFRASLVLPTINNTNQYKTHDFYERLVAHISTLDTMGKLEEINGYVRFMLDKLRGIRADLVRRDDNWENWGFNELIEAIRKWTERNLIDRLERSHRTFKEQHRREHIMQAYQNMKTRECVYCESKDHKPIACNRIQDVNKRRKIMSSKKLRFNCIGEGHCASNCKSKGSCM